MESTHTTMWSVPSEAERHTLTAASAFQGRTGSGSA